jgi:hypothetical protein
MTTLANIEARLAQIRRYGDFPSIRKTDQDWRLIAADYAFLLARVRMLEAALTGLRLDDQDGGCWCVPQRPFEDIDHREHWPNCERARAALAEADDA